MANFLVDDRILAFIMSAIVLIACFVGQAPTNTNTNTNIETTATSTAAAVRG